MAGAGGLDRHHASRWARSRGQPHDPQSRAVHRRDQPALGRAFARRRPRGRPRRAGAALRRRAPARADGRIGRRRRSRHACADSAPCRPHCRRRIGVGAGRRSRQCGAATDRAIPDPQRLSGPGARRRRRRRGPRAGRAARRAASRSAADALPQWHGAEGPDRGRGRRLPRDHAPRSIRIASTTPPSSVPVRLGWQRRSMQRRKVCR